MFFSFSLTVPSPSLFISTPNPFTNYIKSCSLSLPPTLSLSFSLPLSIVIYRDTNLSPVYNGVMSLSYLFLYLFIFFIKPLFPYCLPWSLSILFLIHCLLLFLHLLSHLEHNIVQFKKKCRFAACRATVCHGLFCYYWPRSPNPLPDPTVTCYL